VTTDPNIGERRLEIYRRLLDMFPTGRLADLGTGHGTFAKAAADLGWTVTAIDARTERFPDDERITWVHSDIRDADLTGYDVIICFGLFYHLTLADQLDLLRRCQGTPLIIDTHLAMERSDHPLSEQVTKDGYAGRLYDENLASPLSSWENEQSFWPDRKTFDRMLADHGYGVVLTAEPWYLKDRTFFLCLPGTTAPTTMSFWPAAVPARPALAAVPAPAQPRQLAKNRSAVDGVRALPPVRALARATRPVRQRIKQEQRMKQDRC
jgi:hypothetical protein